MNEERNETDHAAAPVGFRSTRLEAEKVVEDRGRAEELLDKAREKAGTRRGALAGVWEDLMTLQRLLRRWLDGDYPGLEWRTLVLIVTGLLYFVMPLDVIPDFLLSIGFLDDVAIIAYVVSLIKDEIATFAQWELLEAEDGATGEPGRSADEPGD